MTSKKPRLINKDILEMLGYRTTGHGIEHPDGSVRIMELQRTDDGSIADFVYCCHPVEDWGFINEHTLEFYLSRVAVRTRDGEIVYPS